MTKLKIKKGDNVIVIAGKEKGKKGKVVSTDTKTHKVTVDGVNVVTRAKKPKNAQDKGGLIKKTAPLDISNVMLVCPNCGKPSRIGFKEIDGKKIRFCKKCKKEFTKVAEKKITAKATKSNDQTQKEEENK